MQVITFEHEAFKELKRMYADVCQKYRELAKEHEKSAVQLMNVKEVAEMLNISSDTVKRRKAEIGYVSTGGIMLFERANVEAWIKKNSIKPKLK